MRGHARKNGTVGLAMRVSGGREMWAGDGWVWRHGIQPLELLYDSSDAF